MIQGASDSGNADVLVLFLFDLLYLDGEVISAAPLSERKERLRHLLSNAGTPLQYSDHQIGRGPEFYARARELSLKGIISKRAAGPYSPGNRGLRVKVKCQNREEFVVVGWTDPENARSWLGAGLRRAVGGKACRARSPARHAGVPERCAAVGARAALGVLAGAEIVSQHANMGSGL